MSTNRVYPNLPELPAEQYGPNGFDARAAHFVLDFLLKPDITPLWNQGVWRDTISLDTDWSGFTVPDEEREEGDDAPFHPAAAQAAAVSLFDTAEPLPRCGTTACFAGWTAELGGIDWAVSPAKLLSGEATGTNLMMVLVPTPWMEERLAAKVGSTRWNRAIEASELLGYHGSAGLMLVPVSIWAGLRLGITGLTSSGDWVMDPYGLFSGSNDADDVRETLSAYEHEWGGIERSPYQRGPSHNMAYLDEAADFNAGAR